MGELSEQVIVVTGGGQGIGQALSVGLAAQGATVVPVERTGAEVEETLRMVTEAGGEAVCIPADVTDAGQVAALAERLDAQFGRVDVLINNAGSFRTLGPVAEQDPDAWWHDVTVMLLGTFLPCRYLLPLMIEAGRGTIINLAGGGEDSPLPFSTSFASAKAGVVRFTECLAAEVRDQGIAVVCMSPGFVRTQMTEYLVFSEDGRKYQPALQGMFDGDRPFPPHPVVALAAALCAADLMPLTGRYMAVGEDVAALLAQADDIAASDQRVLRLVR